MKTARTRQRLKNFSDFLNYRDFCDGYERFVLYNNLDIGTVGDIAARTPKNRMEKPIVLAYAKTVYGNP